MISKIVGTAKTHYREAENARGASQRLRRLRATVCDAACKETQSRTMAEGRATHVSLRFENRAVHHNRSQMSNTS